MMVFSGRGGGGGRRASPERYRLEYVLKGPCMSSVRVETASTDTTSGRWWPTVAIASVRVKVLRFRLEPQQNSQASGVSMHSGTSVGELPSKNEPEDPR